MRGAGGWAAGPARAAWAGGSDGSRRGAHSCSPARSHAAATAEIKSLGPDRWNDTYYPSGSDAANVHKQWCAAAAGGRAGCCEWSTCMLVPGGALWACPTAAVVFVVLCAVWRLQQPCSSAMLPSLLRAYGTLLLRSPAALPSCLSVLQSAASPDSTLSPACLLSTRCCSTHPPTHLLKLPHPSPARRYVIDAEGQTLGRVASLAAYYIRGKHLPTYTPSMNMGGYGEPRLCNRARPPVL